MGAIEIRQVRLPQDAGAFVKSWWPIYEGDPHWVPPLVFERKDFFNPAKNPYFKNAEVQLFWAWRDGKPVGTISAQIDKYFQERDPGVAFFGFFEFPEDPEVARALWDAAAAWLRERGMHEAWGPFNFNSNHEFGLRCETFDTDPAVANPTNRPYYEDIYKGLGMTLERNWYAYWVDRGPVPGRIAKISERFVRNAPNLELRPLNMKDWDKEAERLFEIYDDAWESQWSHARLSLEEFRRLVGSFKDIVDPSLVWFAFIDGEPAGVAVSLPDYNQVAKKMNGSIFPFGWWHFLFGRKNIDAIRVFILGVKQKFQKVPLGAPLYIKTWETALLNPKIRGADASLVVEENYRMRGALEKLGFRIYQTYRIYGKALTPEGEARAAARREAMAKAAAEAKKDVSMF